MKSLRVGVWGIPAHLIINEPRSALRGGDRINFADLLPGFQLTVADLFARLSLQ